MKNILFVIIWILSRCPLISITLDKNFHEICRRDLKSFNDLKNFRYSLISLGFGVVKIYLCTYKKNEKFKFIKILKLEDIEKIPTEKEVNNKTEIYNTHIESLSEKDINIEIDFLKYKIDEEEDRKSISTNKMNTYTAIVLVVIPLLSNWFIGNYYKANNILSQTSLFAIAYCMLNITLYILNFYVVRAFARSCFKDLKLSSNHIAKLAKSYYEDWYNIKSEADFIVTFVRNVERYIKCVSLGLLILLFSSSSINYLGNTILNKNLKSEKTKNIIFNIHFKEDGQVDKNDLSNLYDMYKNVSKNDVKQIIIIKNISKNNDIKQEYQRLYNSLTLYTNKKKLIEVNDSIVNKENLNYIKILFLEEEYK